MTAIGISSSTAMAGGSGSSSPRSSTDRVARRPFRAFIQLSNLKAVWTDHNGVDQVVRASGIDWTLARAVMLTDKPVDDQVRAAEAGTDKPGTRIYRADLARFLLDTVEQGTWIGKTPLVWNARG
ncbi:NAD(P)H-binding protein [Nonomuraea sp. 3N208]|uniref:NAD(P)H-binding protein n=1 Tax=Nonomuraea sp. 3N208 TaxID=3457421 RepID=UPI003FCF323C